MTPFKVIRTYKRKLILTKAQEARLRSWIGACRVVYNLGMEIKNTAYKSAGKSIHKYELMKQLKDLRKDIEWIRDAPAMILETSLSRLDLSYRNFFRTFKNGGGYPKFASKKTFKSINFKSVKVIGDSIVLAKIGKIRMFKDSNILGSPKTAQVIIEPTGFFVCIQCENVPAKFVSENQAVALDMGLSHFCIDSNGNFIANPKHFKKYERQLRIENRSLSRKKKGGKNWLKQTKRLSQLHYKIGNLRKDFLHKESTRIAKANSIVFLEDLNIRGMVKNGNLAKHISDAGWGMFKTMLSYKTTVIKVNPKGTSQECFECGHVSADNRKSQAEFKCQNCGHEANADQNAAKNIFRRGQRLLAQSVNISSELVK